MGKFITFVLDSFDLEDYKVSQFSTTTFCHSYIDTKSAIEKNYEDIWTYDLSHLSFDLIDNGFEQDPDPTTYKKILMFEVKFSRKRNHIKTRKTSLIDFEYDKFIPVLHIIFGVDVNEDDEKFFQADRIRYGLLAWKRCKNDF